MACWPWGCDMLDYLRTLSLLNVAELGPVSSSWERIALPGILMDCCLEVKGSIKFVFEGLREWAKLPFTTTAFLRAEFTALEASMSVTSRVISPIKSSPVMSKLRMEGRSPPFSSLSEYFPFSIDLYFFSMSLSNFAGESRSFGSVTYSLPCFCICTTGRGLFLYFWSLLKRL